MKIVKVALDVPLDTLFDYLIDETGDASIIGERVVVPFGRRQQVGIIMELAERSDVPASKLKKVARLLRDTPPLAPTLLDLFRFCSRYYHHPLGEVVLNALPAVLRKTVPAKKATPQFFALSPEGRCVDPDSLSSRAILKRKLLTELGKGVRSAGELAAVSASFRPALRALIAQGWIETAEPPVTPASSCASALFTPPPPSLTEEQSVAVNSLSNAPARFRVWLLHGVTGSGKTEVYLHAIAPLIASGQQVLVLVPEINLTPQLEQIFRHRFPDTPLVTLHSGLNETERMRHWVQAQKGAALIVLGTRLAVFAPMPHLAMIVVDEEHDASFKQQEGLRYSARDVAIARAKMADIPIVLGSATPALESYHNALQDRYGLLALQQRAVDSARLPQIHLIDTRRRKLAEGVSEPLLQALESRLQRGEQSLVFINRRGFAPALLCGECGWSAACPRCTSRLVLHLRDQKLCCHHCGHETRIPPHCPDCGNIDMKPIGHGTQRVEEMLTRHFPSARILRVDRDSTRRKHAFAGMADQVREGAVDILVGTQMLAKGHDFPNITLVGVLNADSALYSADFRASERLFAQLMQVAGRAGRGASPGEVLIQTQFPEHALFQNLLRHDYVSQAKLLLAERKQAEFPPFAHLALLRAEASDLSAAMAFLQNARQIAEQFTPAIVVYDPVPAAMARLAGKERAQLLLQSAVRQKLQAFLAEWVGQLNKLAGGKVRWSLDVDPLDL